MRNAATVQEGLLASLISDVARLCAARDQDLTLLDRARQIERLLGPLGWNIDQPEEVTRTLDDQGQTLNISLKLTGNVVLSVVVLKRMNERALPTTKSEGNWLVVTNAMSWQVQRNVDEPVDEILISSERAGDWLQAFVSKAAHTTRSVGRPHLSRQLMRFLELELSRKIDASPDLEDYVQRSLPRLESGKLSVLEFLTEIETNAEFSGLETSSWFKLENWRTANCPGGDIVWPQGATHMLARRGCASFIASSPGRKAVTLLPGSVMRASAQASFPKHHQRLRELAMARGCIVPDGELLRVTTSFPLDTPSAAATFVSGTVENGYSAWRTRDGKTIRRSG